MGSERKYIDSRNQLYYEIYAFFNLVMNALLSVGYSEKDARDDAYDAVELRYSVKRDRARGIMIGVKKNLRVIPNMKTKMFSDNKRLMEILEVVNNELKSK